MTDQRSDRQRRLDGMVAEAKGRMVRRHHRKPITRRTSRAPQAAPVQPQAPTGIPRRACELCRMPSRSVERCGIVGRHVCPRCVAAVCARCGDVAAAIVAGQHACRRCDRVASALLALGAMSDPWSGARLDAGVASAAVAVWSDRGARG